MAALGRDQGVRRRLLLLAVSAGCAFAANSAAAIDTQALLSEVRRGLAAGQPGQIGVICANADISAESALTAEQREVVVVEFVAACGGVTADLSGCPAWRAFLDSYQSSLASLGMAEAAIAADVSRWYGAAAALTQPALGPDGGTDTASLSNFQGQFGGPAYVTGSGIYPGYVTPRQSAAESGVTEPDGSPTELP